MVQSEQDALVRLLWSRWYNLKEYQRIREVGISRRENRAAAAPPLPAPAPAPAAPAAGPLTAPPAGNGGEDDEEQDQDDDDEHPVDEGLGANEGFKSDNEEEEERAESQDEPAWNDPGSPGAAGGAGTPQYHGDWDDAPEDIDGNASPGARSDIRKKSEELLAPGEAGEADDNDDPEDSSLSDGEEEAPIYEFLNIAALDKKEKLEKQARRIRPRLEDDPAWGEGWQAKGDLLGSGAYGVAHIYCRLKDNMVIDRVVVKDTWMPHEQWTCFHKWHGDPRDPDNRSPMEVHCMEIIKNRPGSEYCVKIRGQADVDMDRLWYRIYMDYCPHKSLHVLINPTMSSNESIPEPALWSIFNDLVDACLLLQYGGVEEHDAKPGWEPIVHRDIKLDNIWLDSPSTSRFPSYPVARLGDFGLAIMTDENDRNNPMAYNDAAGAIFWRAPEQHMYLDSKQLRPLPGPKLGEKTNVWGIGAVMVRLMNMDPNPEEPSFGSVKPQKPKVDKDVWDGSKALRDLVHRCVRFELDRRPNLRGIRRQILEHTTSDAEDDLAEGRRTEPHNQDDAYLVLRYADDQYKVGMARPSLKRKR